MSGHPDPATPFDLTALNAYLQRAVGGLPLVDAVRAIGEGHSNPTFALLAAGEAVCVLRKQPPGPLLPSAHAIDREYRVMAALRDSAVPVPQMLHYCHEREVVGTPFYLMEFMPGRVFLDNALPEVPTQERAALFAAMNRTLAALHGIDLEQYGLGDYGKSGAYVERQISRWSRQYQQGKFREVVEIEQLAARLTASIPPDAEVTTLVHGDYRLGNLMFHAEKPEVIAVLDWELSTLGHPLTDLGYNLMTWVMDKREFHGLGGHDLQALGIPSMQAYISDYFRARQLPEAFDPFYIALAFFRLAVIFEGISARARQGMAVGEHSRHVDQFSRVFARHGLDLSGA